MQKALGAFSISPAAQQLTVACKVWPALGMPAVSLTFYDHAMRLAIEQCNSHPLVITCQNKKGLVRSTAGSHLSKIVLQGRLTHGRAEPYSCLSLQISEVHAQLQPFLGGTPCTVAQLRTMARQLGEDDSIEVYYDQAEDRVILN